MTYPFFIAGCFMSYDCSCICSHVPVGAGVSMAFKLATYHLYANSLVHTTICYTHSNNEEVMVGYVMNSVIK